MKDVYLFALKNWENACRLRDEQIAKLERENAALREDRDRLVKTASEVLEAFILHKKVETGHPCPENMCICIDLRAAIDAARAKEGQSWGIDEIIRQHLREGGTPT